MRVQGWLIGARRAILIGVALAFGAAGAGAQGAPELPQASPKARVEQRVGLTDFAVEYSSPGVKDRKIWGELVPYDELWRTRRQRGDDAARRAATSPSAASRCRPAPTRCTRSPARTSWTVILNSNATASGTRGYDEKKDVARITVKPPRRPPASA